jgi:hypothetical protein
MLKLTKPKLKKTKKFLDKLSAFDPRNILDDIGRRGVIALSNVTPFDTGDTSRNWSYRIEGTKNQYKLIWSNSEMVEGVPLVILLQYGHATKSGWFIYGRDFINPALKPIYDDLNKRLLKEVRP